MAQAATQRIGIQTNRYPKIKKTEAKEVAQNGEIFLTEREKTLKGIEFLTQYREDLLAGRPVENLSPSNDPYFLNPEVIADWIQGEKDILAGRVIEIKDPKNIWASLDIE